MVRFVFKVVEVLKIFDDEASNKHTHTLQHVSLSCGPPLPPAVYTSSLTLDLPGESL